MLWIYYVLLKSNAFLLITINSVDCVIQTIYIVIFLCYAPKNTKLQTIKLLVGMNVIGFRMIIGFTQFAEISNPHKKCKVHAISLAFVSHFKYCYVVLLRPLLKDINIAVPNVLGFTFGIIQMIVVLDERKFPKLEEQIIDVMKLSALACSEMKPMATPTRCGNEVTVEVHPPTLPVQPVVVA
ncbi:hypothetical protein POM88_033342 [Heracleum sosnowskyi]|uniref:Uncharacterized protein n=1 Tax=Heracleum sosnowskyi TaxID=360622 RepID=A0AAD8MLU0_9APIA|nr:hypothetical protein POM88_033342 [Heracleum sosnowskyi]